VINKADSYIKRGDAYHYIPMNRRIVGSTGLYTTSEDLSKWANNYDQHLVGSAVLSAKMVQPSLLNSGNQIPYGLGVETKMYKGVKVEFHGGGDAGFRAYLLRVPAHNFSVAVTGNYESFNPLNIAYGMIDIFLAESLKKEPKLAPPTYTTKELERFTGVYQVFPGLYITTLAQNDTLYFQAYGSESTLALPPLAEQQAFEFPDRPHSKIVFSDNGFRWHFSDFSYPAQKVTLSPPNYGEISLHDLVGTYNSEELETSYSFVEQNGTLVATHALNPDITLRPIAQDAFISDQSYLGRVEFIRDNSGKVTHCLLSGQTAFDLHFEKMTSQ